MQSRALVIGGLVVVLAVGFYFLRQEQSPQRTVGLASSVSEGSKLAKVRDDVLIVSEIRPQHVKPFTDFVASFWQRINGTALWKRYDLGTFLRQQFEDGFKRETGDGTPRDADQELKNFYEFMGTMHRFFTEMQNGFFVMSRQTFQVKDKVGIPYILFELAFSTPDIPKAFAQLIDSQLLKGQSSLNEENVTVTKTASPSGARYAIELRPPGVPPVQSALLVDGGRIEYRLGASDDAAFFAANSGPLLVNSDRWKKLRALSQETDAWEAYVEPTGLIQVFGPVVTALAETDGQPLPTLESTGFAMWKDMDGMLISTNLYGGLRNRSCVAVRGDTELAKTYKAFFEGRGSEAPPHRFRYLLGDRSILGLQLNTGGLAQSLQFIGKYVAQGMAAAEPSQVAEMQEGFARVQQFVSEFGFREVGVLMDGPAGMPLPEGGMYLGSGKVAPKEVLAKLESSLTSLIAQFDPQSSLKVSRANDPAGRELLHLGSAEGGMELIGSALEDGSVLFGINELYLDGGAAALRAKKSKLDSFNLKTSGLDTVLPASDYYFYLNTEPAFVAIRPFLPMMLSQQPGNDITPGDVEEILNILSGAVVVAQRTERPAGDVVCSENVLATLTAG